MSIIGLSSCAYAKGVVHELFTSNVDIVRQIGEPTSTFKARLYKERFRLDNTIFKYESFEVTYKKFVDKFPQLIDKFSLWGKRYSASKKQFMQTYNTTKWNEEAIIQSKHSLFDCQVCMKDLRLMDLYKNYPVKSIKEKKNAVETGVKKKMANKENIIPKNDKLIKAFNSSISEAYQQIDQSCMEEFRKSFVEIAHNSKDIPLQKKQNKEQVKSQLKSIKRKMKHEIEDHKKRTSVER